MTTKFKSISFSLLLILASCNQEGDKTASVAKPSAPSAPAEGSQAPAASCPAGQMKVGGNCVLTNQTRACASQPVHSTGGTQASADGGQTWGSCSGFTCNYKYYFDPFLGGGTCTNDNFIATYTNNNPLSACDGTQNVVQTLVSCIGQNTSVSDNSECAATSNVSMWSPAGTRDVTITNGVRHDNCSFGSSIPSSQNVTCDLNYFADNNSLSCVSGLQAHYKADSIAATNGQSVCVWSDENQNSQHRLLSSSCPTYVTNAQNGKPALSFDGVSQSMSTLGNLNLSGTDEETLIVVYKDNGNPDSALLEHSPNSWAQTGLAFLIFLNGAGYDFGSSIWVDGNFMTSVMNTVSTFDDSSFTLSVVRQKTDQSSSIRLDRQLVSSTNSTGLTSSKMADERLFVGARDNSSFYFYGQIAEIIIFDRQLLDSEVQSVELALKSKYALP